jgi:DNA modification methylase
MQLVDFFSEKDFSLYTTFDHARELPRHRWYYFKEGFSPLLVKKAIEQNELRKNDLVIDTFSGSGTVPLVASELNINSIGLEVNPFMSFISKAKLTNLTPLIFNTHFDTIIKGIRKGAVSALEGYSTFSENTNNSKWLFNKDVLRAFEGGWKTTDALPYNAKRLYRLSLVSSIMMNSNAVKDGKCMRYKKNWKDLAYSKDTFIEDFVFNCKMIEEDIKHQINSKNIEIIKGDVRKELLALKGLKFKLCITSPPYLNSFDYSDIYRPELFLCKFVQNNRQLGNLRQKTIRSHMQINWDKPQKTDFGLLYLQCITEILKKRNELWNRKIPSMIQAYFEDIETVLANLKKYADKNASIWLVVSTSAYAGIEIPVDLIIADIGDKLGWNLEEIKTTRYMRNSTQNAKRLKTDNGEVKRLRESIVIMKNK